MKPVNKPNMGKVNQIGGDSCGGSLFYGDVVKVGKDAKLVVTDNGVIIDSGYVNKITFHQSGKIEVT